MRTFNTTHYLYNEFELHVYIHTRTYYVVYSYTEYPYILVVLLEHIRTYMYSTCSVCTFTVYWACKYLLCSWESWRVWVRNSETPGGSGVRLTHLLEPTAMHNSTIELCSSISTGPKSLTLKAFDSFHQHHNLIDLYTVHVHECILLLIRSKLSSNEILYVHLFIFYPRLRFWN